MTAVWLAAALAGGFVHRATREPLPARDVERPLVLPLGWTEVAVAGGSGGVDAAARMSIGAGAELRAALPWRAGGLGAATVGGAWMPWRREAPARSVALSVAWTAPEGASGVGPERHALRGQLEGRRQWGGLALDAHAGVGVGDRGPAAIGGGATRLQAGPLGGRACVEAAVGRRTVDLGGSAGGFVQLNRAALVRAERLWAAPGPSVVVAVELSL